MGGISTCDGETLIFFAVIEKLRSRGGAGVVARWPWEQFRFSAPHANQAVSEAFFPGCNNLYSAPAELRSDAPRKFSHLEL